MKIDEILMKMIKYSINNLTLLLGAGYQDHILECLEATPACVPGITP